MLPARPAARLVALAVLLPLALAACQSSDDAAPPPAPGEPAAVETLQSLFPEAVRNLQRTSVGGELEGALGFQVSRAVARYGANVAENRPFVVLAVLDTGSAEMAGNMGFGWGLSGRTPETGRATLSQEALEPTTLDGHPARRSASSSAGRTDLEVLVAERFYVEAHGSLVDPGVLDEAVRGLDLDRLAALAE